MHARIGLALAVLVALAATLMAVTYQAPQSSEAFHSGWSLGPDLKVPHSEGSAFVVETTSANYLYVAGGTGLSGYAEPNVERAEILPGGMLGSFELLPPLYSLPGFRLGGSVVVDSGWVYYMGGWNNGSSKQASTTVFRAPIDDVTGLVGPWEITAVQLAAMTSFAGSFVHEGNVYLVGGTCNSAGNGCPLGATATWDFVQRAQILSPGVLSQFTIEANLLTQRLAPDLHTVVADGYVYNFGGGIPASREATDVVERAQLLPAGMLGTWNLVGYLPLETALGAALLVGDQIIVAGGYANMPAESRDQVFEAPASSPVPLSTAVPLPTGRHGFAAAQYGGRAYILSGQLDFGPDSTGTLISAFGTNPTTTHTPTPTPADTRTPTATDTPLPPTATNTPVTPVGQASPTSTQPRVTRTPTATSTPPSSVGGVSLDPTQLPPSGLAGYGAALLASVAGALALGGAIWWARRRVARG